MKKIQDLPVEKNGSYVIEIESQGSEGEGIGKVEGFTVFVPNTLPGDQVQVKMVKVHKNYGFGRLEKVLRASSDRQEPVCQIAEQCGGCQLQHQKYEAQLEFKRNKVEQALKRIGGLAEVVVNPTIGMEKPYFYRNKGQFPVGMSGDEVNIGFYAARSHRIIPFPICYIQHPAHVEIIDAVKKYMAESKISPYDEEKHTGLLRHIVTRQSKASGDINVTLVINGKKVPNEARLVELLQGVDGVKSICLNVNKDRTNVILGEQTIPILGDPYIVDTIGGISFRISPLSFYQVNPEQTEKLYQTALDYAGLTGDEIVWDAYCGIGTITLFLAQRAKKVYGVEIVPEAIKDADYNKELNGIENVEFFVGKAEEVITKKYKEGIVADVMVVDPPRKGCDEALPQTMLKMQPKRIVYVSCDPGTLARDLKSLVEGGYQVEKVQPVDMFAMTGHVETVCLLSRKAQ